MDRLNYFYVRVGDHNETNLKGNALCANYNGTIGERWFSPPYAVVECTQPLRGRFLSVQLRNDATRGPHYSDVLNICEVDIRGYKGKSFRPWFGYSVVRNSGQRIRRGSRMRMTQVRNDSSRVRVRLASSMMPCCEINISVACLLEITVFSVLTI